MEMELNFTSIVAPELMNPQNDLIFSFIFCLKGILVGNVLNYVSGKSVQDGRRLKIANYISLKYVYGT